MHRDGLRSRTRQRLRRGARAVRGRSRNRAHRDGRGDRGRRRGARGRVHLRARRQAGRGLHRGVHGAPGQADGSRRCDRHGVLGHRAGEGGGARARGREGRQNPHGGRRARPGRPAVTAVAGRPWIRAGWADALGRGFVAFLAMTAIGQVLAFLGWFVADTGASAAAAVRLGSVYFGVFHHVAVELDVSDLEIVSPGTAPVSTSLSIGVAMLSLTAVAAFLLFRAGRRVADRAGGSASARVLLGASLAPSYAIPAFVTALLVEGT